MTGPRIVTALFLLAYAAAVTWPVMSWVNRVEPLVFGLPFNLAWVAGWIVGTLVVLAWIDRVETRRRATRRPDGDA